MLRATIDLTPHIPVLRPFAQAVAETCSRYSCTITLEHQNIILNLKSMIGLLSQHFPPDGILTLVTDGPDEAPAMQAVKALLE